MKEISNKRVDEFKYLEERGFNFLLRCDFCAHSVLLYDTFVFSHFRSALQQQCNMCILFGRKHAKYMSLYQSFRMGEWARLTQIKVTFRIMSYKLHYNNNGALLDYRSGFNSSVISNHQSCICGTLAFVLHSAQAATGASSFSSQESLYYAFFRLLWQPQ